jgi:hypothetical protein
MWRNARSGQTLHFQPATPHVKVKPQVEGLAIFLKLGVAERG